MEPTPRVSVVLPTFNRPDLLAEAIASVQRQTVHDWELIVVDNGSDPPAVVPDDPRIVLVRVADNRGPSAGRNAGIDATSGAALAFLDDDDLFAPERLRIGLTGLQRAPIAICATRFLDTPSSRAVRRLDGDVSGSILDGPTPCLGATMIARDACERFDERWEAVEDVEWWWRTTKTHRTHTADVVGYLVRRHDGARTRNSTSVRVEENLAFLTEHAAWFELHPRARAFRLRRVGLMALSLGDRTQARRLFVRSLRARPTTRSLWHLLRTTGPSPGRSVASTK